MSHDVTDADIATTRNAARYFLSSRNVPREERDDYEATALLGLAEAARTYEGGAVPFMAYAHRRIKGAMLDAMRQADPLSRGERASARVAQATGTLPDPATLPAVAFSAFPGDDPSTVHRVRPAVPGATLDRRGLASNVLWKRVQNVFPRLRADERRVLVLTFGQALTLKEAGAVLGLSESGVCRLRARALRKVRDLTDATIGAA